jgi:thiol:disulfide interchange protein DsbD
MIPLRTPILMLAGLSLASPLRADLKSGHASAGLVAGVSSYRAGQVVPVAIRLAMDPGWHSYWINPGEAGVPLKAVWTLPAGWQAGELRQPVPKRFTTGGLAGFGYEGEALFLVDLTPPAGAAGEARCQVKLSWLTCNDDSCVPGTVELDLLLPAGDGAASPEAGVLAAAAERLPRPLDGLRLEVGDQGESLRLTLHGPAGFDPTGCEVFFATPQAVDPAERPSFVRDGGPWSAVVRKNEYAEGPAALLEVVLAGGKLSHPVSVLWRAAK